MKRAFLFCTMVLFLLAAGNAEEKKVQLKDLPSLVQKTVQNLIRDAELKGLSEEEEDGKTVYEAETVKNGKSRDILMDATGAILEIEEGTTLDGIPGPAKAAIEKAADGGKVMRVESVTRTGAIIYEAVIKRGNKSEEIGVQPDGSIVK